MPNLLDPRAQFVTCPPPGYHGELIGWEVLAERIHCQRGVVAVVPDPQVVTTGMILLPDQAGANMKPDVGTVVSSGWDELVPGDRVIYAAWAGTWFIPFVVDGYRVDELRFYGLVSPGVEDMVVMSPLENEIPAKLTKDGLKPLGELVLIKRDPMVIKRGALSIELPESQTYRNRQATVISAGPKAVGPDGKTLLKAGDRVVYHGSSLIVGLKGVGEQMGWTDTTDDYALIRSRNLYCVLSEETKTGREWFETHGARVPKWARVDVAWMDDLMSEREFSERIKDLEQYT